MIGAVLFMNRDWLGPVLIFLFVLTALTVWSYARARLPWRWAGACLGLKVLGVASLLFFLLEPHWAEQRARPGANELVLLADNSQGLQIRDVGHTESRGQKLRELLTDREAGWMARLSGHFQIRRYAFDTRLDYAASFETLDFSGRATALGHALETIRSRFENRPLAGVILFTDGNATDWTASRYDLAGLPPIYPVLIGEDTPLQDVSIERVAITQAVFEDNPVTLNVSVRANGYAGQPISAQVFEFSAGEASEGPPELRLASEQVQSAPRASSSLNFRFTVRPRNRGLVFFQVRVAPQRELSDFPNPETSSEATLANNQRTLAVQLDHGPYRLLYVSGRPNWEYKFLSRALAGEDQLELTALIRLAKREPKFEFRGRPGERTNPFFRGFDQTGEETERYDQPVLLRLNTRDQEELKGGFPATAEELFEYHAVIVDSVEAEFFTRDQMALLRRFVSERGGGFLMLGGAESFQEGQYQNTPISELLPVYLRTPDQRRIPGRFSFGLTVEGSLQPWMRLRSTEAEETERLRNMPPFQVMNRVAGIKPGATALALFSGPRGEEHPGLVVQRFGHGRSAGFMVGDFWRWGLRSEAHQRDLARSWRQMARWLVTDTPPRIQMTAAPKLDDPAQGIELAVRVRDKSFEPIEDAAMELETRFLGPAAEATEESPEPLFRPMVLRGESVPAEPGLYQSLFVPRWNGAYHAEARILDERGNVVGRAQAGWTSDPAAEEFQSLQPNRELLEWIAGQTGGRVFTPSALDKLAGLLPRQEAPVSETWTTPIWHTPVFFLFALSCFVAEWGLRRWKGLP